jgi:hypothetical protein
MNNTPHPQQTLQQCDENRLNSYANAGVLVAIFSLTPFNGYMYMVAMILLTGFAMHVGRSFPSTCDSKGIVNVLRVLCSFIAMTTVVQVVSIISMGVVSPALAHHGEMLSVKGDLIMASNLLSLIVFYSVTSIFLLNIYLVVNKSLEEACFTAVPMLSIYHRQYPLKWIMAVMLLVTTICAFTSWFLMELLNTVAAAINISLALSILHSSVSSEEVRRSNYGVCFAWMSALSILFAFFTFSDSLLHLVSADEMIRHHSSTFVTLHDLSDGIMQLTITGIMLYIAYILKSTLDHDTFMLFGMLGTRNYD